MKMDSMDNGMGRSDKDYRLSAPVVVDCFDDSAFIEIVYSYKLVDFFPRVSFRCCTCSHRYILIDFWFSCYSSYLNSSEFLLALFFCFRCDGKVIFQLPVKNMINNRAYRFSAPLFVGLFKSIQLFTIDSTISSIILCCFFLSAFCR